MNISCPSCEAKFDISEPGSFQCPSCGFSFDVSKDEFTPDEIEPPIPVVPTLKKCPFCLAEVPFEARKCSHCGEWLVPHEEKPQIVQSVPVENKPKKSNMTYILLSIFFGNWGVGEFYADDIAGGFALLSLNIIGIATFEEGGIVVCGVAGLIAIITSLLVNIEKEKAKPVVIDTKALKSTPKLWMIYYCFPIITILLNIMVWVFREHFFRINDARMNASLFSVFSIAISIGIEFLIGSSCNIKTKQQKIGYYAIFFGMLVILPLSVFIGAYFSVE